MLESVLPRARSRMAEQSDSEMTILFGLWRVNIFNFCCLCAAFDQQSDGLGTSSLLLMPPRTAGRHLLWLHASCSYLSGSVSVNLKSRLQEHSSRRPTLRCGHLSVQNIEWKCYERKVYLHFAFPHYGH